MLLTIFTPTFNRAKLLTRTYEHLCSQTNRDFLWFVVDDGSTDGTEALVRSWQKENRVLIEYHYQSNRGKMAAHNYAVAHSKTSLFLCVDSDDYLTERAVELIAATWNSLCARSDWHTLAGIIAYKGRDCEHTMNGERFPDVELTTQTCLYGNGFHGETTLVYRTEVLKKFPFPVFEGETFIPEAVVFDKIDMRYQLFVLPQILMICEYQPDGLTNAIDKLRKNNPNGWLLYYQNRLNQTPVSFLRYKYLAHAICFAWYLKKNIFKMISASKAELILAIPGALVLKVAGKL